MWFITGFIICAIAIGLALLLRKINLLWYEWIIGSIGLLLFIFTIQNFVASFIELAPSAALMFLLVTGLPSIILFIVVWQLASRRAKKA